MGVRVYATYMSSTNRMLRAAITENEHNELRVIATRKRISAAELVAQALRTAPVTRGAFKGEETK